MVKKMNEIKMKKLIGGVIKNIYGDSTDTKGQQVNLTDKPDENPHYNPMYYKLLINYSDPTGNSDTIQYTGQRNPNLTASDVAEIRSILLKSLSNKQKREFNKQEQEQFDYRKLHAQELQNAEKNRRQKMQDDRNNPLKNDGFWTDFGEGFQEGLGNTLNYGGKAVGFIPGLEKVGEGISSAGQTIQNFGKSQPQDEEISQMEGGKIHCKVCNKTMNKSQWKKHKLTKLHGAGLISWMKDKASKVKNTIVDKFKKRLDGFNNTSTATLKKYGDLQIISLRIFKKPIHKILDLFINAISLGNFEELKRKYGFDQMYHLGCIASVKMPNGKLHEIQFEKVEAVKFFESVNVSGSDVEYLVVPLLNQNITLNAMTEKARLAVGDKTYFDYRALGTDTSPPNNCQYFIKYNLMDGLNIWNGKINSFVMQDVNKLGKEMPEYTKTIMNSITDAGQIVDNLTGGSVDNKLTIHAIKIHNSIPKEEQIKHVQSISKSKKRRLSKPYGEYTSYRIIPKTRMIPKSYRTKSVMDGKIKIVFAKLK